MSLRIQRRDLLLGGAGAAVLGSSAGLDPAAQAATSPAAQRLRALETGDARLGVYMLDTGSGEALANRPDEAFAMCSTFKLALVAAYLREADASKINLDEILPYGPGDLLEWAPITGANVDRGGLPVRTLMHAAQTLSDGVAANLLVRRLGGPARVTAKFREMHDTQTRLDRYEPMLGMVLSADLRDTTTPRAMAHLVARITTGDLLAAGSRALLLDWMTATQTGARRLRAGLPAGWRAGNKTGTGRAPGTTNKCNDIAVVFPPGKAPIIITAYYDSGVYRDQIEDWQQAVLADVGRIAADWAGR